MAELPIILAGPILRRVTPRMVAVWVALSRSGNVKLSIWNKQVLAGVDTSIPFNEADDPPQHTATNDTIRIGEKLHITVVTIRLDPLDALFPGEVFSYNISFSGEGIGADKSDLKSNGLLIDDDADENEHLVGHLALGYIPGMLPGFTIPPLTLEQLNIAHGSCRKAHGYGKDSLAALDTILNNAIQTDQPAQRTHQLYFTGDQIYADEVPISMLYYINKLGNELLGMREIIPALHHNGSIVELEVTLENFPQTRRQRIINKNAKLTTDSLGDNPVKPKLMSAIGMNHLMSFGEFCATYLLYWSNTSWNYAFTAYREPAEPRIIQPPQFDDPVRPEMPELDAIETLLYDLRVIMPWISDPLNAVEEKLCPYSKDEEDIIAAEDSSGAIGRFKKNFRHMTERCKQEMEDVKMFLLQLPKARRVMANVPVYMIFDDHEVADDWNGSRNWREKVYGSPLGRSMVRNAMAAYAIFQDWGNLPDSYNEGPKADLLFQIQELFKKDPDGGPETAPAESVTVELDILFGLNLTDESPPPVKWHYSVPCGETTVYVLDTRTRRTFPTKYGFPGLMTDDALDEQLPRESEGGRMIFIVSPAPVLGLGTMEILIQPVVQLFMKFGADPEPWSLNPPALEKFLDKIEKFDKVVLLSGDVHYSITTTMDYWKKDKPHPSRFVQLVSSSLKNEKFLNTQFLSASMVQQVLQSLFYPIQRLGWKINAGLEVSNTENIAPTPAQRISLRKEPVLLNAKGWPDSTVANRDPDWAWSMEILRDIRTDDGSAEARPTRIGVAPFDPDINPALGDVAEAYTEVLGRHVLIHQNAVSRSVVWKSNIGLIKFTINPSGELVVTHQLLYWLEKDDPGLDPEIYTSYTASLEFATPVPISFQNI